MSACGELVDELLRRVRDPQGTAHPRWIVRDLLDRAQVLYVRQTGILIQERDQQLFAHQLVYTIDPQQTLRILDLYYITRRLWPIRWPQMVAQRGQTWWRGSSAAGPRVWAPLGTTHFVVYPAPTSNMTISVREQYRPAALTSDTVDMQIPNEFFPRILDLVETLLLLRQRDPALPEAMKRLDPFVKPDEEEVA